MSFCLAATALAAGSAAASGGTVDFVRPDLSGTPLRLSQFRGRYVVVNFWATWCGPCIYEIPVLEALHRQRDDVVVLGVNFEEIALSALARFVDEMGISYPVVIAGVEPLLPFEPLKGLPSTFVVSPAGELAAVRVGAVDRDWLDRHLPPANAGMAGL